MLNKILKRKGDIRGVRNFIGQEIEDFTKSRGVKNKVQSLATSGRQAVGLVKNKVSDMMSYPARRKAQKSVLESEGGLKAIKDARKGIKITPANFPTTSKKNKNGEIINPTKNDVSRFNQMFNASRPSKLSNQKSALKKLPMQKIGKFSNGIGVGP